MWTLSTSRYRQTLAQLDLHTALAGETQMHPFGCGGNRGDVAHGTRSPGDTSAREALRPLESRTSRSASVSPLVTRSERLPNRVVVTATAERLLEAVMPTR